MIVYSLSQLYTNCSVEFLPPYVPSKEEKEDPKMFAANVRGVMADSLGVGTTDCSYFDYLKIEKCRKVLKHVYICNVQKIFDDEKQSSSNRYRFSAAGKKNRFTDTIISWMMELLTRKCHRRRGSLHTSFETFRLHRGGDSNHAKCQPSRIGNERASGLHLQGGFIKRNLA